MIKIAPRKIYTIGYEGSTLSDFIGTLQHNSISLLVDIRELPQSRRPGFSKKILSASLKEAGINYCHIRQLGDPKPGRDAAKRGDINEFRSIFNAHLSNDATQTALHEVAIEAKSETIALMCYERLHQCCHRSLVADRISDIDLFQVIHLHISANKRIIDNQNGAKNHEFIRAC
ncbi:DUF488 domain-containing protein [Roseomonas sp. NAR14]|uniref:DUF488 domain-containing protein n=1 Tax=Roseomonas acroporae TaxID=2937791 RepID=A0A9X1YDA6_9PROT|nr:DUF488 domain-containing protein [Roseomonas acroporae]MCK8786938.1 DUF488 domain-containing protein [Roseomonas acroporae]